MRKIFIDCLSNQKGTALCEDEELIEFIPQSRSSAAVGNIYCGIVEKILPSKFAFINIGEEKNAFMQLSDKKQENLYEYKDNKNYGLKIKQGDCVVVQIEKEAYGLKSAAVSFNLNFVGKYAILITNQSGIGISKKIEDEELKKKLKNAAESVVGENYAVILRTSCEKADIEEIKSEIIKLYEKSVEVLKKGLYIKPPAMIYEAENETEKLIRDFITDDKDEIIVNEKSVFESFLNTDYKKNLRLYEDNIPMFNFYGIQSQLEKALNNKIWLKSGGFIIIDEVEACTVIDVNSGKFIGKDKRKTALKTNLEACREAAKQIRLRNLSGMIIIDFIDMVFTEDKQAVTDCLKEIVKKDRISTTIVGMTELGLMQLTRKKTRISLGKALTDICPHCGGRGRIENESYTAQRIYNRVCSIFADTIYNVVTISANKKVIDTFKGLNNEYLSIEKKFGKKIKFNVISAQKSDYFEIEKEKI